MSHRHVTQRLFLVGLLAVVALALGSSLTPAAAQTTRHRIEGRVYAHDGAPMEGITVHAYGESGNATDPGTSPTGDFSIEVPSGSYTLRALVDLEEGQCVLGYYGSDGERAPYWEVKQVAVSSASVTGIVIKLPAAISESCRRVQGIVTDGLGEPLGGHSVKLHGRGGSEGAVAAGTTEADGTFTLYIGDGTHAVLLAATAGTACMVTGSRNAVSRGPALVTVDGGDTADIRIKVTGDPISNLVAFWCQFEAPHEMVGTELQPGWNLAGWTETEADVSSIFGAIPQLEGVYSWDPASQAFREAVRGDSGLLGPLSRLKPGMGLWLHIGGEEPVAWTRALLPESGLASLSEGWNLVNWSGHEGLPPAEAFASLGVELRGAATWDRTAGRFLLYHPEAAALSPLPSLEQGDAVWVNVSAGQYWLQPGAFQPGIDYHGDVSEETRASLPPVVDEVIDYFATRFGLFVPDVRFYVGDDIGGCAFFAHPTVKMAEACVGAVTHEYSHAIQHYVADGGGGGPAWMTEGVASRWDEQHRASTLIRPYEPLNTVPAVRRTAVPLEGMETYTNIGYEVGQLAAHWLVTLTREDSLLEFYRQRISYPTWEEAFEGVFGMSVPDFYVSFAEHRAEVAPPLPQVAGTVLDHEGNPLAGARLRAEPQEGQPGAWATTGDDGSFSLRVHEGAFLLEVHTPDGKGTRHAGWYADEVGFTPRRDEAMPIRVEGEDLAGISIQLPDLQWFRIEGAVVGPDGEGIEGIGVDAYPTGDYPGPGHDTDADGVFRIFILGGTFELHLYSDTPDGRQWIGVYGGDDGFSPRSDQTDVVSVDGQDVIGITIRLPADPTDQSQWRWLEGVVLGPDGQPQEGVSVDAYPAGGSPGHFDQTDESGAFSIAVLPGPFVLNLNIDQAGRGRHLGWYTGEEGTTRSRSEAQVVTVGDEDLTGVTVRLPLAVESSSWRRISGVVLGPEGEPLEGVRVQGDGAAFFANWSVTTGVDGRFEAFQGASGSVRALVPRRQLLPGLVRGRTQPRLRTGGRGVDLHGEWCPHRPQRQRSRPMQPAGGEGCWS